MPQLPDDRWNPACVPDAHDGEARVWGPGHTGARPTRTDGMDAVDTDADGRPDTIVTDDGFDLVLHTDLDGDGLADQVLRIGPDGVARGVLLPAAQPHVALPDSATLET